MYTKKIDVDTTALACLFSETQNKPAMVFLHGASSTNQIWLTQWMHFKDRMTVIIPDLPGHGDSTGNGSDSIDKYAEIVVRLIRKLDLGKCILVGHSMGGATAQKVAIAHSDLLAGLVLVSTGSRLRVASQVFSSIETDYRQYIELATSFSLYESADEQTKNMFKNILSVLSPKVAYNDFMACNKFDVMNEIAGIHTRTLIIAGDKDMLTPLKYSQFMHQKIANSQLDIIRDAGHMVMMEKPDDVNSSLSGFLKG